MRGGHNRTHRRTTAFSRIDSRDVAKICQRISDEITHTLDDTTITIKHDRMVWDGIPVEYSFIRNGFGGSDRLYLLCPACNKRFRILYEIPYKGRKIPACRECSNLNYLTQQRAHGWREAAERVLTQLEKMGYDTKGLCYADAEWVRPVRPKGQHMATYNKNLVKLLKLQMTYRAEWVKAAYSIIGRCNMDVPPELLLMQKI